MLKFEINANKNLFRIEASGKTVDIITDLSFAVQTVVEQLEGDKEFKRNAIDAIAKTVKKALGLEEEPDFVVETLRRVNIGDILKDI